MNNKSSGNVIEKRSGVTVVQSSKPCPPPPPKQPASKK